MKSSSLTAVSDAVAAIAPVQTPVDLDAVQQQVEQSLLAIRLAATSTATWSAYQKALRYIAAWMQMRLGEPLSLPVPVSHVQLFVVDHFGHPERIATGDGHSKLVLHFRMPKSVDDALIEAGYKNESGRHRMTTIDQRLAILSWAHQEKGFESPCRDASIRRLLSDCRKLAREIGEGPKSKTAATVESLDLMLQTCDESLEGRRDRAILLFGWASGGRRRSEIARAEVRDLEWIGVDQAVFRMRTSKTDDAGPKPIKGETAAALRDWLRAAGISEGPMFRRLWGKTVGAALSPHAIAAIVQRRANQAGLPGDFAGHSLRRGFVTEAGLNDVPLAQTMAMTGHRLTKSVVRYSDVGDVLTSKASDLVETGRNRRKV